MLNLEKSSQAFAEAKEVMPGGVNSPVRSYARVACNHLLLPKLVVVKSMILMVMNILIM